ncbi:MAG TPA: ABC transporter permease, partial [Microthrixaceae bacterium]|nr:ABC transporter permease [Microthrixaceae bacterium]
VFGATAANEVMVGSRLADSLGVTVGSTVKAGDGNKKVVGIFTTGNVFGDSALMFPLIPFQAYERQPGGLSMIFAKVQPGEKIPVVQKRVETEVPLLIGIKNLLEFGRADRSFQLITAADRAATIVAIVVGAVIVMNTMLLSLVERYREFGVLRAIGWSRRRLISLVGGEAAIIGLMGAILGVILAVIGTEILARLPSLVGIFHPNFEAWVFGRALLTAAALTLLGALYPAIRAARLAPLEALRRE